MRIAFFLYETGYTIRGNKPLVQLFGRTPDNKQICVLTPFEPYFWIVPKEPNRLEEVAAELRLTPEVTKVEQEEKQLLGKSMLVLKVVVTIPSEVPLLRERVKQYGQVLEADILFARRYLIDHEMEPFSLYEAEAEQVDYGWKVDTFLCEKLTKQDEITEKFKILSLDIETYNAEGRMPNPERDPIIMIGLAGKQFKKVLTWKQPENSPEWLEVVADEKSMLQRLVTIMQEEQPDSIAGYFSDGFDLPYLIKRAEKHNVALTLGLDATPLRKRKEDREIKITGISHFDVLNFIKKVQFVALKTPTYTLNAVAKELLGEGKKDVEITALFKAWDTGEGLADFLEYNLQDAELTYRLAEKVLDNVKAFAKLIGLPVYDVTRLSFSQLVEWYLLRLAHKFNQLAPNRPSYGELSERRQQRYVGGYVYEPKPGIYKDIMIFDFLSLYPTIISTHNISPDTLNVPSCKQYNEIEDAKFCQEKPGFIATVIKKIIDERKPIKQKIKEATNEEVRGVLEGRSQALKILANSMYGYFGFFGARWYSGDCAKAISAFSRKYIKQVIEQAKSTGFDILYSDTDSVFFSLRQKSKEDAFAFLEKINSTLPGIMELEYESYHPAGLFVQTRDGRGAKKRYAMLNEDGTIKVRGFQTVRRNSAVISRETQKEILSKVLKHVKKEDIVQYIKDVIKALREHTLPVEKVIITTQLQRSTEKYAAVGPHVKVAERLKEQNKEVAPGDIISYVVTTKGTKIRDKARLPEETNQDEYDANYYIENQVVPATEQILELIGVRKEELLRSHQQNTLGDFL